MHDLTEKTDGSNLSTVNEPVFKNCEIVLDEASKKLQSYFEKSDGWIETLLLTVGFYFLSVAVKSPEEIEILGAKISINGDHRELFIALTGATLIFRLIQNWIMSRLHAFQLEHIHNNIIEELQKLQIFQREQLDKQQSLLNSFLEEREHQMRLPEPGDFFDVSKILVSIENPDFGKEDIVDEKSFKKTVEKFILSNREKLILCKLDKFYPIDLWNAAADATIAEALQEYRGLPAMQTMPYIFDEFARDEVSEKVKERIKNEKIESRLLVVKARERAIDSLRASAHENFNTHEDQLKAFNRKLEVSVARIEKMIKKVNFYYWINKSGQIIYLFIPASAAVLSAGVVIIGI